MNNNYQWFNRNLPQTLVNAQMLCYISGVLNILQGALYSSYGFLFTIGLIGGAFGIANEKKWGYGLALVTAAFLILLPFYFVGFGAFHARNIVNLMFDIALFCLLAHPDSRNHQKIYFK